MPKTKLEAGLYSDASGRQAAVYHCAISLCICCIMRPAHLDISERFCNNKSESFSDIFISFLSYIFCGFRTVSGKRVERGKYVLQRIICGHFRRGGFSGVRGGGRQRRHACVFHCGQRKPSGPGRPGQGQDGSAESGRESAA